MVTVAEEYFRRFVEDDYEGIPEEVLKELIETRNEDTRYQESIIRNREEQARKKCGLLPARLFKEYGYPLPEEENPNTLFKHGWLRKGGLAFLISESGVGKSTFINQAAWCWSVGEAGLGPRPVRPLRIAIVQNEDDDDEMREFHKDLRLGFRRLGWSAEKINEASCSVVEESQNFAGLTGEDFIRRLHRVQKRRKYDLIIINPMQGYTGFDISQNAKLSEFLRESGIKSVAADPEAPCGIIFVHHTNKPPVNQTRDSKTFIRDINAYAGAGGAEITNSARAILVLKRDDPKDNELAKTFSLIGVKRGERIGWKKQKEGVWKRSTSIRISHSDDILFWITAPEPVTAETPPKKPGRERIGNLEEDVKTLLDILKGGSLTRTELRAQARNVFHKQQADRTYTELVTNLKKYGLDEIIEHGKTVKIGFPEINSGNA